MLGLAPLAATALGVLVTGLPCLPLMQACRRGPITGPGVPFPHNHTQQGAMMLDRPLRRAALIVPFACAAAAACASSGEKAYIAPTEHSVTAYLEASYDGRGQHIVVRNASTESITVTSINLTSCENIKNRCEVQRMRVTVHPGATQRIVTVQTDNPARGSNFRWSWTWQTTSTLPAATE